MTRTAAVALAVAVFVVGFGTPAQADHVASPTITPTYSQTYADCTTNQNEYENTDGKLRWTISPGCDSYQNEYYERPTTQTFEIEETDDDGDIFAAKEYFANLDIEGAQAGVDDEYFYGLIDMVGTYEKREDGKIDDLGLKYEYVILLSTEPDGADGVMFSILDGSVLGTTWQHLKNEAWSDTDGDVGGTGLMVTKEDLGSEVSGDGFDLDIVGDGQMGGAVVMWTRIDPTDPTKLEFAIDYSAFGFTQEEIEQIISGQIGYIDFRAIKGGPKDPQNYLWNDEYTKNEAGSPYPCGSGGEQIPCDPGKSIFNTQGTGNIYELDTLRGIGELPPVDTNAPEPASVVLIAMGLGLLLGTRWLRTRRA